MRKSIVMVFIAFCATAAMAGKLDTAALYGQATGDLLFCDAIYTGAAGESITISIINAETGETAATVPCSLTTTNRFCDTSVFIPSPFVYIPFYCEISTPLPGSTRGAIRRQDSSANILNSEDAN